jgi:hypothetical protein
VLERETVPSVNLAATVAWAWDVVAWALAEACLVREGIAIGRAAVVEMAVNAAEKADTDLAESHTGKEVATSREEMAEDAAVPAGVGAVAVAVAVAAAAAAVVVAAAAAGVVDFEVAAAVAVEAPVAVVEGMMFAQKTVGRSASSVLKEDHPVDHRYYL